MSIKPKVMPGPDGGSYILHADGKYYYLPPDLYKEYRQEELKEEVLEQLERAREKGFRPSKAFLDTVIAWQNEKSPGMAVKYIGYKLLGEYTYLEVFGREAKEDLHFERTDQIIDLIKNQQEQIAKLQQQLCQMQTILINLAKSQNDRVFVDHKVKRIG